MSFAASRTMSQFVISTSACTGPGRPPPRPRPRPRPRPPPPRPRPRPRPFGVASSSWSGDAVVSSRASQHFGQTSKLHGWHLHKVGVVMRIPQISHQFDVVWLSSSACACSDGRSAARTRAGGPDNDRRERTARIPLRQSSGLRRRRRRRPRRPASRRTTQSFRVSRRASARIGGIRARSTARTTYATRLCTT